MAEVFHYTNSSVSYQVEWPSNCPSRDLYCLLSNSNELWWAGRGPNQILSRDIFLNRYNFLGRPARNYVPLNRRAPGGNGTRPSDVHFATNAVFCVFHSYPRENSVFFCSRVGGYPLGPDKHNAGSLSGPLSSRMAKVKDGNHVRAVFTRRK